MIINNLNIFLQLIVVIHPAVHPTVSSVKAVNVYVLGIQPGSAAVLEEVLEEEEEEEEEEEDQPEEQEEKVEQEEEEELGE